MPGPGGTGLSDAGPSRAWYGVAAAVLLVGLIGAATVVFLMVDEVTSAGFKRFTTTAPVEVDLSAGAERTIYTADPTADSGFFRDDPECKVVDLATGRAVPTGAASSWVLTLGEETYQAALSFRVDHDGRYRVDCSAEDLQPGSLPNRRPVPMAVGPRIRIFRSAARVLGAGAIALFALCVAVAIVAVTAVKRHERRAARA